MPNRYTQYSSAFKLSLALLILLPSSVVQAQTDEPGSDLKPDTVFHSAAQLTLMTRDRRFEPQSVNSDRAIEYSVVNFSLPKTPEPYIVPPDDRVGQSTDTWIVYQDYRTERSLEEEVFANISDDFVPGACAPGLDCPDAESVLPFWPEENLLSESNVRDAVSSGELISPFDTIPELQEFQQQIDELSSSAD